MHARFLACSLLLTVLGSLMIGCSDDTRRITSPGTVIQSDPLSTSIDETGDLADVVYDEGFPNDPWNTDIADDEVLSDPDDPMDQFDGDDSGSNEPLDKE